MFKLLNIKRSDTDKYQKNYFFNSVTHKEKQNTTQTVAELDPICMLQCSYDTSCSFVICALQMSLKIYNNIFLPLKYCKMILFQQLDQGSLL